MSSGNVCLMAYRVISKSIALNLSSLNGRLLSTSGAYCTRFRNKEPSVNYGLQQENILNPGLGRRLKIIKQDTPNLDSTTISEEDIEQLEGDFLNAREMEDYYAREAVKLRHRNELKMTERKHFKPAVEPNLLNWSDKEQIRHLHGQDPHTWTVHRLAESFPATPEIIKKVLKSQWKPQNYDRIKRHDEVVRKNWIAFSENKLNISSPVLREHLKKFSKRTSLPSCSVDEQVFEKELPKPQKTEFVSIIHSYKSQKSTEEGRDIFNKEKRDINSESYFKEQRNEVALYKENLNERDYSANYDNPVHVNPKSHFTLEKLRLTIKEKQLHKGMKNLNVEDSMLLKGATSKPVAVAKQLDTPETISLNSDLPHRYSTHHNVKFNNSIQSSRSTYEISDVNPSNIASNDNYSYENIPNRIHIPKSKKKIGFLYKVNDCFYSHDGYFLYRVPGMVDENN